MSLLELDRAEFFGTTATRATSITAPGEHAIVDLPDAAGKTYLM